MGSYLTSLLNFISKLTKMQAIQNLFLNFYLKFLRHCWWDEIQIVRLNSKNQKPLTKLSAHFCLFCFPCLPHNNETAKEIYTGNKLVSRHSDNLFKPKIHLPRRRLHATLSAPLSTLLLFAPNANTSATAVAPAAERGKGERKDFIANKRENKRRFSVLVLTSAVRYLLLSPPRPKWISIGDRFPLTESRDVKGAEKNSIAQDTLKINKQKETSKSSIQ